jgi:hypothetical protein
MTGNVSNFSEEEFVKECIWIVEEAKKNNVTLRILGALAVYIHCSHSVDCLSLYTSVKRLGNNLATFTDMDLITYSSETKHVEKFFEKVLGFKPNLVLNALYGKRRSIYYHPSGSYYVDIFYDKLEFSHNVDFGSKTGKCRLEYDYPTITLADIVLEKTQINRINLKDILDLVVLFLGHDIGTKQEKEVIDGCYIATILSDDWGFWYDATNNLNNVKQYVSQLFLDKKLKKDSHNLITERVNRLLKMIDDAPKTKNWQKRAKIGTSKPWYREIEEVVR